MSVTLFLVALNSIQSAIPAGIAKFIFADDIVLLLSGKSIRIIQNKLESALEKISNWSKQTGFRFSVTKTKIVHFCRKTNCTVDPVLFLDGNEIEVVDNHKFLGMNFDRKLNWNRHIKILRNKAMGTIRILRTLSNTRWGSDRRTLLVLYKSLVLSKIDYGSFIYSTASKTALKSLDSVHNPGVRLATGALRTSPVISLLSESGMLPLNLCRDTQLMAYATRASSLLSHPLYGDIKHRLIWPHVHTLDVQNHS